MKVIVADQFSPAGLEEMKSNGIDVIYDANLNGESLKNALADVKPQALIVRSTKVEKVHIDACSDLKLIVRAGAGYDTIDFEYAAS